MKKQTSYILFLLLAHAILFSSCKKNNDPGPTPKTKTELITQNSWKFKSATANGSDVSNQAPPFDACRKDNILTFISTGNGNVNEGPTSCSPPENGTFNWSFTSNETILNISTSLFPGVPNNFTLVSLTETELVLSFPYNFTPSISVIVVVTFQH